MIGVDINIEIGTLRHRVSKRLAEDGKADMVRLLTGIVWTLKPSEIAEMIIDLYSDAEVESLARSYGMESK